MCPTACRHPSTTPLNHLGPTFSHIQLWRWWKWSVLPNDITFCANRCKATANIFSLWMGFGSNRFYSLYNEIYISIMFITKMKCRNGLLCWPSSSSASSSSHHNVCHSHSNPQIQTGWAQTMESRLNDLEWRGQMNREGTKNTQVNYRKNGAMMMVSSRENWVENKWICG
jgi:hypothetical protein